jgi:hypothetical protein
MSLRTCGGRRKMLKFRDLTASEIECRVQSVKQNGLILLLYKDARVDMNILDETVGAENWQREHYECKGNLFCRVGIDINAKNEYHTSNWVWKSDCGTESNTEAQKGEASDSFKRACFNWGIGRELYTAPFTWISSDKCNIKDGKKCFDNFEVKSITIQDKRITSLEIWNATKKCSAFAWSLNAPAKEAKKEAPAEYTCENCGKAVDASMALRTQKAFGVFLCRDCGVKRSASANKASEGAR